MIKEKNIYSIIKSLVDIRRNINSLNLKIFDIITSKDSKRILLDLKINDKPIKDFAEEELFSTSLCLGHIPYWIADSKKIIEFPNISQILRIKKDGYVDILNNDLILLSRGDLFYDFYQDISMGDQVRFSVHLGKNIIFTIYRCRNSQVSYEISSDEFGLMDEVYFSLSFGRDKIYCHSALEDTK